MDEDEHRKQWEEEEEEGKRATPGIPYITSVDVFLLLVSSHAFS